MQARTETEVEWSPATHPKHNTLWNDQSHLDYSSKEHHIECNNFVLISVDLKVDPVQ